MTIKPLAIPSKTILLTLALIVLSVMQSYAAPDEGGIKGALRTLMADSGTIAGEPVYSRVSLSKFYNGASFQPVWVNDQGPLPLATDLIRALRNSPSEGLRPEYYHSTRIDEIVRETGVAKKTSAQRLAELDALCTDAFLTYGADIKNGRINPARLYAEKYPSTKRADVISALKQAVATKDIAKALAALEPEHLGYGYLQKGLAEYRAIEARGGWPHVPEGPPLRPGMRDRRVADIQKRLFVTGDLRIMVNVDQDLYSAEIENAVREFQLRHGLEDDAVVGPETIREMNVTVRQRIRQIELNLERWRWLPPISEGRFILVNVTNFHLDVFENFSPVLSMRVVVGKPFWDTPAFKSTLTRIVFNPTWNVPKKIAFEEVIPNILRKQGYLEKNKISVIAKIKGEHTILDPSEIDWANINEDNINFRFRQAPGPKNPLGSMKFIFSNSFEVYLHDTPSGGLFGRNVRTFSHGCIRIEKPMELALYLLRDSPEWTAEKIRSVLDTDEITPVTLKEPIDIHLLYLTAWVTEDGTMQFRRDFYERDEPLEKALSGV